MYWELSVCFRWPAVGEIVYPERASWSDRCSRCALSPAVRHFTTRGRLATLHCQTETATNKYRKTVTNNHSWSKIMWVWNIYRRSTCFTLSFSVPARHMIQGSRPPKTFLMRWSASFDSTLSCIALSTLWPAGPCSHVSGWSTRSLRLWWTEFWRRMDNMKSCFWEQVRHTLLTWSSIFHQQRAQEHFELSLALNTLILLIPLWPCSWKNRNIFSCTCILALAHTKVWEWFSAKI